MVMSIDGKVTGDFLYKDECAAGTEVYYQINRDLRPDAFACGRTTMEGSFTGGFYPDLSEIEGNIPHEDYVANKEAIFFAVAFDRNGKLGWKGSEIIDEDPGYGNSHIIEVLTHDIDDRYLSYLRKIGVSYIFADKDNYLNIALEKLKNIFGIEKMLLEGGSIINGAFEREELIDELSIISVPMVANAQDKPLFYDSNIQNYELISVENMKDSVLWLRYKKVK